MSRFAIYDDEDVEAFKSKIMAKRTQESTNFAINILNEYYDSQTIALVLQNLSSSALNNLLSKFYLCVTNKKGEYYKINSMRIIRLSLQRYFLESLATCHQLTNFRRCQNRGKTHSCRRSQKCKFGGKLCQKAFN